MTEHDKTYLYLSVCRNLANRFEDLPDDSPRAQELHNLRKKALHEALDGVDEWTVENWGVTNNVEPHEHTEIILALASHPYLVQNIGSGLAWVGTELAKAGVAALVGEAVKLLLMRLIPEQQEKRIANFEIKVPEGVRIWCNEGKITIDRDE